MKYILGSCNSNVIIIVNLTWDSVFLWNADPLFLANSYFSLNTAFSETLSLIPYIYPSPEFLSWCSVLTLSENSLWLVKIYLLSCFYMVTIFLSLWLQVPWRASTKVHDFMNEDCKRERHWIAPMSNFSLLAINISGMRCICQV